MLNLWVHLGENLKGATADTSGISVGPRNNPYKSTLWDNLDKAGKMVHTKPEWWYTQFREKNQGPCVSPLKACTVAQ